MALLAVALLGVASDRSIVMRATPAGSAMPTMVMCETGMSGKHRPNAPSPAAHKICPYCDAAAHTPLSATETPLRASDTVSWTHYAVLTARGPRGPPAFAPKATGPPSAA